MRLVAAALIAFAAIVVFAQPQSRPGFEAASFRRNTNCANGRAAGRGPSPGRLSLSCASIRSLISAAYGAFAPGGRIAATRLAVTGGPGWLDSELYDLNANAPGGASLDQIAGPMLQKLLEDRCQLKIRRESKEVPVYSLTVAKDGPKLKESTPDSCAVLDLTRLPERGPAAGTPCGFPSIRGNNGNIIADGRGMTMSEFAGRMFTHIDRPVVDKTGLAGRYDIHLEYLLPTGIAVRASLNGGEVPNDTAVSDGSGSSFFSAVARLGLRLTAEKGTVDAIVVDAVERPSEN